jgi:hypothetical protein
MDARVWAHTHLVRFACGGGGPRSSLARIVGETTNSARPLAVVFHEKDRSPVTGLRFGVVEVLLADEAPVHRGFLPKIGAEAVARELGVPLLFDPRFN